MIAGTLLAGLALLAALWFAAIAPKRSERAKVRDNVVAQEARLAVAKTKVVSYQSARKQFPGLMAELKRLDVAVPGRGAIAKLLRELQRRARVSGSDLRLAALKTGGAPADGAARTTPGATTGPGGMAALPFTFEYEGEYFDLLHILRAVRKSVKVRSSGDLAIGGRLLTIDGLTFNRSAANASRTTAVVNATAYIAPDGAASPQAPADATIQGAK
jgi:Tfp pilus assembly protein PilO